MALTVKKHQNGYLIQDKVFITTDGSIEKKYINLALQTGEDMHYGNHDITYIDYPGEYDFKGIMFSVWTGKWGELNYLVKDGNKSYAFVQTEDALNDEDFNAQYWLFSNQHISNMLDKMELEGEKINLSMIE